MIGRIDADSDQEQAQIRGLEKRIVGLEGNLKNIPSVYDEVIEHIDYHRKLDKRIAAIEDKLKEQTEHNTEKKCTCINPMTDKSYSICMKCSRQLVSCHGNGPLKALHTLLGELI